jgi:hypothetical protein
MRVEKNSSMMVTKLLFPEALFPIRILIHSKPPCEKKEIGSAFLRSG